MNARCPSRDWTAPLSALRVCLLGLVMALQPCRVSAETVRIATINLRNYLVADRMVEGVFRRAYPKPEREKAALRSIITSVGADVLAVQEIGGSAFVRELQRDLAVLGIDYSFTAISKGSDEQRHTALLARIPFNIRETPVIDFAYFGARQPVKRGLTEAVFVVSGVEWSLFNIHLKSRWTDRSDDPQSRTRRERESRAIRNYLKSRFPDRVESRFIVAGDFNATKDTLTVRQFLRSGETKLSLAVPAMDSRGEAWTYYYRKADTYSRVDFILASAPLFQLVVDGGGTVYDGFEAAVASDHRMVYVDLNFPDSTR